MGFSSHGGGVSKYPSMPGNTVTSRAAGITPLAVRAHASQTAEVFQLYNTAGVSAFGMGPAGGIYTVGNQMDFWAPTDTFARVQVAHSALGAGLNFGSGGAAADTVLSRSAPLGTATSGTFHQDGRRFDRRGAINVRDRGAVGDNSTDDRAAIQAAIDAVPSTGGAVFFPPGSYRVDCTTQGIILPLGKVIYLVGESGPTSIHQAPCRIRRLAGAQPLVRTDPAWNGGLDNKVHMTGLEWDGSNTLGAVAHLPGLGHVTLDRVRFTNQARTATAPGVNFTRAWDLNCIGCNFDVMGGTESSTPAVLLANSTSPLAGVNTVQFTSCYWWSNQGADLRIDGSGVHRAAHISIVGCKFEFSGPTAIRDGANLSIGRVSNVNCAGNVFYMQNDAQMPCIRVDNTDAPGGLTMAGCTFEGGTDLIDQNGQYVSVAGCFFNNYSAGQVGWDIASTVGAGRAQGAANSYFDLTQANQTSGSPTNKRYTDHRSGPTGPQSTP